MTITGGSSRHEGKKRRKGEGLKALEAFANLGDRLDEWRMFLKESGRVFPEGLATVWLEEPTLLERVQADPASAGLTEMELKVVTMRGLKPSLVLYRDALRAVWTHNDAKGHALAILLGFPEQVEQEARTGVPLICPLPSGQAVVNGITGAIEWKFGCEFQLLLYDLLKERWRTKVCPVCARYFIAAKAAQTLCSPRCFRASKRKRALEWWNRKGRKKRERKSRKRRS